MTEVAKPNPTLFSNNFWGKDDAGFETLKVKIYSAKRTFEDLKALYNVRATLHEEFGRKLAKHLKTEMAPDETGTLGAFLASAQKELEETAKSHLELAHKIRSSLELSLDNFTLEQKDHRKLIQTNVDRAHRNKQLHEAHVAKSREKYESECAKRISLEQQVSVAGYRDSDRLRQKLDRCVYEIKIHEQEYRNACTKLAEATTIWNSEWRIACDTYQVMEEKRIEFLHHSMSVYIKTMSSFSSQDLESHDRLRKALDQIDMKKDLEDFVKEKGTGPVILEAPEFVHYTDDPVKTMPKFQTANFSEALYRPMTTETSSTQYESVATIQYQDTVPRQHSVVVKAEPSSQVTAKPWAAPKVDDSSVSVNPLRNKALPVIGEQQTRKQVPMTRRKSVQNNVNSAPIPIIAFPDMEPSTGMAAGDEDDDPHERIDPRATVVVAIGNNAFETDLQGTSSSKPDRRRKTRCARKQDETFDISIQELLKELGIQQQGKEENSTDQQQSPVQPSSQPTSQQPQPQQSIQQLPQLSQPQQQQPIQVQQHPPVQTQSVHAQAQPQYQYRQQYNQQSYQHPVQAQSAVMTQPLPAGTSHYHAGYHQDTYERTQQQSMYDHVLTWGRTLYEHHSADPNCLSFPKGALLAIVRFDSNSWWTAYLFNEMTHTLVEPCGLVASNFVTVEDQRYM